MPIKIKYPQCGKTIRVADEHAGRKGKCPVCHGRNQIPTADIPSLELVSGKSQSTELDPQPLPANIPPIPSSEDEFGDFLDDEPEVSELIPPHLIRPNTKPAKRSRRIETVGTESTSTVVEFLDFRRMIVPIIIRILFCVGVAVSLYNGVVAFDAVMSIAKNAGHPNGAAWVHLSRQSF